MKDLLLIALFLAPMVRPIQVRNGVVTGQLLPKDGLSVSGVRVSAMAVSDSSIPVTNASTLVSFAITDGAGRYRLENVSPGRYYVMAGLVDVPTYYPGVSALTGATVVTVVAGATVAGIDFPMIVPVGFVVSGRIIPPPNAATAGILRASLIGGTNPRLETTLNSDGSFQFVKVLPGSYILLASTGSPTQSQSIVVADRDVTGIEFIVPVTVALTGTMSVDGGGPLPRMTFSFASFKGGVTAPGANTGTNGEWRTLLPEGEYQTTWSALPAGYTLKSITAGSLDLLKNPLKVAAGAPSVPITVTLGVGSPPPWAKVSGRVVDPGTVLKGSSSQLTLRGIDGVGNLTTMNTVINPDGSFEFEKVQPGRYTANLIPALPVPAVILSVSNKDLSGVEILIPRLKEITGHIVFEGLSPIMPGLQFRLMESSGSQAFIAAIGQPDGAFKVTMPEGDRRMFVSVPGYSVKSLSYGSRELTRDPLVKISSGDNSELQVTLSALAAVSSSATILGGVVGGVPGGVGIAGAPPPPPPPPSGSPAPIRVGGEVQARNLIYGPTPAYPPLARAARIEGVVILQATIGENGSIKDLRVITSTNPLLLTGVLDTVRTWQYKPVVMNQIPVEVSTTITVNFSLGASLPVPQQPPGGPGAP